MIKLMVDGTAGYMLSGGGPWDFKTRLKTLLDLHRLCARDAIMIPYKTWTWNSFRLRGACD